MNAKPDGIAFTTQRFDTPVRSVFIRDDLTLRAPCLLVRDIHFHKNTSTLLANDVTPRVYKALFALVVRIGDFLFLAYVNEY